MRIPIPLGAIVAVLAAAPSASFGAMGNVPPVVDTVEVSPVPVPASASAMVSCAAHDDTGIARLRVRVNGGSLPGGATLTDGTVVADVTITPGASASGSIAWTTPVPGAYTVTCIATDTGGTFGAVSGTKALTVDVVQTTPPPVLQSLDVVPPGPVLAGARVALSALATDPSGGAITYAWSASGGALAPAGETATWTAPAEPGTYELRVTASNADGLSVVAARSISVAHATYAGDLDAPLDVPTRIATSPRGDLWVVDGRAGRLLSFTVSGNLKFAAPIREQVVAVAAAPAAVYAATRAGQVLELDPATGAARRALALRVKGVAALAWEPTRGRLWIAQRGADRVVLVTPDGAVAGEIAAVAGAPIVAPVGVAVDAQRGLVWIAQSTNEAGSLVHAFTADGAYVRSIVPFGSGPGKITRTGGLAVDADGRVYVADLFQGNVQVVSPDGSPVAAVGEFGAARGQLRNPSDVALLANGDVVVANSDGGRVERFSRGAPLPTCPGDSDCDGLPDAWELAHGLNPNWAGDAALDYDGDGLSNAAEFALGTDPRRADTDGDGYSDGEEVLAGFSPLDPDDHRPVVASPTDVETGPGLVRLRLQVASRDGAECAAKWRQVAGPRVTLRDARTLAPSFVARRAGTYEFSATSTCGAQRAGAVVAHVKVRDVAPRPDAGGVRVVAPGTYLALDGAASSDANGDRLALRWDQALGAALTQPVATPLLPLRAGAPGLSSFALTATDPGGNSATAEVPVLVVDPARLAPTALPSSPVVASVGDRVQLDASASTWPAGDAAAPRPWFIWTQVAGAQVALDAPESPTPTFLAAEAGRYSFEVSIADGLLRSPPARVEVFVAEAGGALPVAVASAPASGRVGEPLALDGSGSSGVAGGTLAFSWQQLTGPAAGLTDADAATATVVPFEPGYYEFELTVAEGPAKSLPARVSLVADAPGQERLVASASGPAAVSAGGVVQLTGAAVGLPPPIVRGGVAVSTRPARFAWTQVAGPWVALQDGESPAPRFVAVVPGVYSFDLVVESAGVRSAPARVSVLVTAKEN